VRAEGGGGRGKEQEQDSTRLLPAGSLFAIVLRRLCVRSDCRLSGVRSRVDSRWDRQVD
jgi:hypothetical protein